MFAKWHEVNGIKCQGNIEKNVAIKLFELNKDFKRGTAIKTPFGNYTPDFDCGSFYLEVKSLHSWLQALGATSLLENAKKEEFSKKSNNSQLKMEWVNTNIKPMIIYIEISKASNKFIDIIEPWHDLEIIKGDIFTLQSYLEKM